MTGLTLDQADRIAAAAIATGIHAGFSPICVVVMDAAGHMIALKRQDGASSYRVDIAHAKSAGCIGMGMGGRAIAARATKVPAFYAVVSTLQPLVPVPGGVLVRSADGAILGAVGISGDTSDNDEICALAGIAASGLVADAGAA